MRVRHCASITQWCLCTRAAPAFFRPSDPSMLHAWKTGFATGSIVEPVTRHDISAEAVVKQETI